ncbi:G-protein coupled receptor 183-like [Protopterus annectens]|uniref:G-protein coupled receptor 183-like n=1 Tax=Protopterus annectens TaxID=7888 RepID=UPI001CFA2B23|nr:G-protein coupled receptor 183-like [Protopterus annectens]
MEPSLSTTSSTFNESECYMYIYRKPISIWFSIFYSFVSITGIIGNIIVLYVIRHSKQKINSTVLYLVNLSIADLMFTFSLPIRIAYYILEFNWKLGTIMCRISGYIFYLNMYASISFMTCISMDRYFAVIHPIKCQRFRRVSFVKYICFFAWLTICCTNSLLLFLPDMLKEDDDRLLCMEYPNFENIPRLPQFLLLGCVLAYYLPVAFLVFCYTCVSLKLRTLSKNPLSGGKQSNAKCRKSQLLVLVVLLVFVLCYTPYHLGITRHMLSRLVGEVHCETRQNFQLCLHLTISLMNINCCMNPLIYFFASKSNKTRIWELVLHRSSQSTSQSSQKSLSTDASNDT